MVSELSIDTVGSLWEWASEAGGSAYVRRQCVAYLRNEFSRICSSHVLFELDEELLHDCLLSDYVEVAVYFIWKHLEVGIIEEHMENLTFNAHIVERRVENQCAVYVVLKNSINLKP